MQGWFHLFYPKEFDGLDNVSLFEGVVWVVDVGDTTGHTSGKIPSRRSQDHDSAPCHVFATVVSYSLDRIHSSIEQCYDE